ncbi:hypothetical protein BKA61DRAFT_598825 [Leptodontidium sp. MPI-SDFR-AT-0119]|nr:hypothetical protein BKA61DRAFT_598825 [Leptodontidium sp. MPI-SDFR-AT-0119]
MLSSFKTFTAFLLALLVPTAILTTAQTTSPPAPTTSKTKTSDSLSSTKKHPPTPPSSSSSTSTSSSTSKSAAPTPVYVLQCSSDTNTQICAREPNKCACTKDAVLECAIYGPGIFNGCASDGGQGCRCEGICLGIECPL